MHSSILRSSDFELFVNGSQQDHEDFFHGWTYTRRLGFVAENGIEGIGSVNLVMAHATAFYNVYRATKEEFFAYPDFFSFQHSSPKVSYSMLDIHPDNKHVDIGDDPQDRLDSINDRGVNVLIVPEGPQKDCEFHKIQMASARRNIDTCYVYSFTGKVAEPDLTIRCPKQPLYDEYVRWINKVFDSVESQEKAMTQKIRSEWTGNLNGSYLEQSFRRVDLDEALRLL